MPGSLKIQNKTTKGILNVRAIKNRIVSSQLTWITFAEQLFFATMFWCLRLTGTIPAETKCPAVGTFSENSMKSPMLTSLEYTGL